MGRHRLHQSTLSSRPEDTGARSRILVTGAYRPEEVALGWDGDRHPLQKVLGEFKRTFGDNWVDLAQAEEDEGRRFVDVLLDTQANRLAERFRQALFRQTTGHPLFTTELLRAMQARGDLVEDEEGRWVEGPALDWQLLPARVEAVIEERLGRLDEGLHGILAVASVEGETFTPAVVARVQGLGQLQVLRHLSQELGKRHRLVREQEEVRAGASFCPATGFPTSSFSATSTMTWAVGNDGTYTPRSPRRWRRCMQGTQMMLLRSYSTISLRRERERRLSSTHAWQLDGQRLSMPMTRLSSIYRPRWICLKRRASRDTIGLAGEFGGSLRPTGEAPGRFTFSGRTRTVVRSRRCR